MPETVISINYMTIYRKIFIALTRLPNFKGKVGVLRRLHNWLPSVNLENKFLHKLTRPVAYNAYLDTHCAHELMAYLMSGYEEDTVLFLDKIFNPSGYFLDIGANIGLITLPFVVKRNAANQQQNTQVFCIEAIKSNAETLNKNIAKNQLENQIHTFNLGLGDKEKSVDINVEGNRKDGQGTGTANILSSDSDFACERIQLSITTIDKLVEDGKLPSNCSLIKIDTDGYDLFIMKGAEKLLKNAQPIIYGEFAEHCLNWHNQSITDVIDYMNSLDYTVLGKSENNWHFNHQIDPKTYIIDLLLVPNSQLKEISRLISLQ